jgi:Maltokinase N-terminal cap domain
MTGQSALDGVIGRLFCVRAPRPARPSTSRNSGSAQASPRQPCLREGNGGRDRDHAARHFGYDRRGRVHNSPTRQRPELTRAGGFRLDDPEGEVGIEFMVVIDGQDGRATAYLVPLTYRGSTREDSGEGLIGTAEHGVLGQRWVYDGTRDPVLIAQLVALIQGAARPQAQSQSDTPDPTVHSRPAASGPLATAGFTVTSDSPDGTDLRVEAGESGALALRIHRILTPMDGAGDEGSVTATWQTPDGARVRGVFVTAAASAAHR